jgi:hypothetical protein
MNKQPPEENAMSDLVDNPEEYFRQLVPARDALLIELEQEALPAIVEKRRAACGRQRGI